MITLEYNDSTPYLKLDHNDCMIEGFPDDDYIYFEISTAHQSQALYDSINISLDELPDNFEVYFFDATDIFEIASIFRVFAFEKKKGVFKIFVSSIGSTLSHKEYKDYVFYESMIESIDSLKPKPKFTLDKVTDYSEPSILSFEFLITGRSESLQYLIKDNLNNQLNSLTKIVDQKLQGLKWDIEFEKNESAFSQNLLQPLFWKMGFEKVIYNHGSKEFGRDFILSKTNEFGIAEYYGVQVKAGSISGKVNSQIDELINQYIDAISMPWEDVRRNQEYISKFIIVISGHFKANAKDKIKHKIPASAQANIIFLDKDSIIALNRKFLLS